MINLGELQIFLTAAEHGNFSEAARRLHISQPAVSQAVDSLEHDFGCVLFLRQGRRVVLTDAGQALRQMAQELLTSARRLDEEMTSLQGEVIGEINVGCSNTSGKYLLPGIIAEFRHCFPHVRVNVDICLADAVISKLLAGQISIGISSKRNEHRDLEFRDLFVDQIILIAPAGHPWKSRAHINPGDLLSEPLILREESAESVEILYRGLREHGVSAEDLDVVMVLNNPEAIEMAVEKGIGVAFISRLAAARGLALRRIEEIPVEGLALKRSIYLARNRRYQATPAQAEFWKFIGSAQAESGLWHLEAFPETIGK